MRELDIGTKQFTRIRVMDEPGEGGACHEYEIGPDDSDLMTAMQFGHVRFQNGPIKEADIDVNGCQQEDLIAICIDRLRSFQAGVFVCRENALALTKLEEALMWLNARTEGRVRRGVEGTNQL